MNMKTESTSPILSWTVMGLILIMMASMAQSAMAAYSRHDVQEMVVNEAIHQGFPWYLALAVAKTESDFDPYALSHAGARGVMQIMPRTAREDLDVSPSRLYNPRVNINAGIRFLSHLIDVYGGRIDIALSHYNGGSAVRRPNGQLRVIPATRNYVAIVLERAERYQTDPKWRTRFASNVSRFNIVHADQDAYVLSDYLAAPSRKATANLDDFASGHIDRQLQGANSLDFAHEPSRYYDESYDAPKLKQGLSARLDALISHNKRRMLAYDNAIHSNNDLDALADW